MIEPIERVMQDIAAWAAYRADPEAEPEVIWAIEEFYGIRGEPCVSPE